MWTFFISRKYFLSKKKEGMISLIRFISTIGVALGVASLIIVLSVMNGFDAEVRDKIVGTYAHVMVTKEGGIADFQILISKLESMPEVQNAADFITGQAVLRNKGSITGILLKGIDPERETVVTEIIEYTGNTGIDLKGNTIILGKELMRNEGISIGGDIEILVPYSTLDLEKIRLKVIGSFDSGRYDYDANIAVVNIETAQRLFRMGNKVTGVGLKIEDGMKAEDVKSQLRYSLKYPFIIKTWMDLDKNLVTALALEKKMMFIVLALIIMVACFNIAGSLIMMVMEKTRDIGILKAIGANSRGVSFVFLLEGAMIGILGTVLGGFSGVFIANRVNSITDFIERITGIALFPNDIYYFTEIPVQIRATDVNMIVCMAMVLTLIAGIYPAWKASRLDPVEAIRYE